MTHIPTVEYNKCHAKVYLNHAGTAVAGCNVYEHSIIVGLIAKEILNRIPSRFKRFFPNGSELIAACHDVGKVSPGFYLKLNSIIEEEPHQVEPILNKIYSKPSDIDKSIGGHATVSAVTLKAIKQNLAAIVSGSHHGYLSPKSAIYYPFDEVLGGEAWHSERLKLINALKNELNCDFPQKVDDCPETSLLLSGLTCVADWVGSGEDFKVPEALSKNELEQKIKTTLDQLGFIRPSIKKGLSFSCVFGFAPNDLQKSCINIAGNQSVFVLEAAMGEGKTEAALYMAYQSLCRNDAQGIYFALPTQITSNKIYERFDKFINKISSDHRTSKLLHSNQWLRTCSLGGDAEPGKDWFDGSKRGLLAPFAVGTLDQALLSVLNVKHNFVRSFGLMGKVVIIDEVHSYDAYTGLLLDELVQQLVALKCVVIILSATLNKERKEQLLRIGSAKNARRYPCLTIVESDNKVREITPQPQNNQTVFIKNKSYQETLSEAIKRASEGQYVLWIENTVDEAIDAYSELFKGLNEQTQIRLIHSRFMQADKSNIEDEWSDKFGKDSKRNKQGCIWIGTQILEQSLDIDADFIVTRLAPSDFLVQRIGRLWRHKRSDRNAKAVREAWVISPSMDEALNDGEAFGKTGYIYGVYPMLKTLKVWSQIFKSGHIEIPADIPRIIKNTYEDDDSFENLIQAHRDAFFNGCKGKKGVKQLKVAALNSLATIGKPYIPEKTSTRYIEVEQTKLYLFSKVEIKDKYILITLLSGESYILDESDIYSKNSQFKSFLVDANRYSVKCPHYLIDVDTQHATTTPKYYKYLYTALGIGTVVCEVDGGCVQPINAMPFGRIKLGYCPKIGLHTREDC